MKYKGIQKKEEGKFITRYDISYKTEDRENCQIQRIWKVKRTYEAIGIL